MSDNSLYVCAVLSTCLILGFASLSAKRRKHSTKAQFDSSQPPEAPSESEALLEASEQEPSEKEDSADGATFGRDGRLAAESHSDRQVLAYSKTLRNRSQLLSRIQAGIIGDGLEIETNFGKKRAIYCDWTASAKGLSFVESYIRETILPLYANTHSMENRMGLQTTCFREEAREIIQLACNGNRKKDVVLFVGNGSTAAIQKLVSVLGLSSDSTGKPDMRCVVFVGPFEHTSNLLAWRESRAHVVVVPENPDLSGKVDLTTLCTLLDRHAGAELKIGSFSACSNVTGVLEDVDAVTTLLHKKGALAFWDYASAGPYVDIDMNPVSVGENRSFLHKDAVFISSHKFVGGPGGTGVLVAKRTLFNNRVPHACGGGTVYFVDEQSHRFLSDITIREEGGTPNIVGCIRAGMAFKIKQSIGVDFIAQLDQNILEKASTSFSTVKEELVVLGPPLNDSKSRLPTFSFLIRRNGRYLHHNFVVALLSDLYGIQSRGGCLCAGPYVQNLLGMSISDVDKLENTLVNAVHQMEQYRPGVTRVSIPYFFDEARVNYVLKAICDIAKHGWRLLPLYRYENTVGEWGHRNLFQKFPQRIWLADFLEAESNLRTSDVPLRAQAEFALATMLNPPTQAYKVEGGSQQESDWLRWFVLPSDASAELRGEVVQQPPCIIVQPHNYAKCVAVQISAVRHATENSSAEAAVICQIRPQMSKRAAKQPKRAGDVGAKIVAEQELAFAETVQKHMSLTVQMSEAELFPSVPPKIMKLVVQASKEWSMINPGDKLLLGLSGGKDSLCLLHVLLQIQKRAPFRFEIACCTIEPGAGEAFDPSPLIPYVKSLGLQYHFEKTGIFDNAKEALPTAASYCSFCARMKRGALYRVAREHGYTALVLAQHLDDFVESFFMSAIRNGHLRTMKANYVETKGEVRIIRPLCYVRERDTKDFSFAAKLPVINENCPACFSAPTERERVKRFLRDQERLVPNFFESVRKAILPLMDGSMYPLLHQVEDRLKVAKSANPATKDARKFGQAKTGVPSPLTSSIQSNDSVDIDFE